MLTVHLMTRVFPQCKKHNSRALKTIKYIIITILHTQQSRFLPNIRILGGSWRCGLFLFQGLDLFPVLKT